jgi:hypothetical protein
MFADPARGTLVSRILTTLAALFTTFLYAVCCTLIALQIKETKPPDGFPKSKVPFPVTISIGSVFYAIGLLMFLAAFLRKFAIKVALVVALFFFALLGAAIAIISFLVPGVVKSTFESFFEPDSAWLILAYIFTEKRGCSGWDVGPLGVSCSARFDEMWKLWGILAGAAGAFGFLVSLFAGILTLVDGLRNRTAQVEGEAPGEDPENPEVKDPKGSQSPRHPKPPRKPSNLSSDDDDEDSEDDRHKRAHKPKKHKDSEADEGKDKKKKKKGGKKKSRSESDDEDDDKAKRKRAKRRKAARGESSDDDSD